MLGGAGVVAYEASRLPPIDQLAVPKRPPNIAIQGDDGTLLANRGDTGGAAVRARRSAALSAQGLRRDRGPALLPALRHRPGRHRPRRSCATSSPRRRRAGRLDPDPAARQEPVPDPGADAVAQDPGSHPGALARAQILEDQILELYLNRVYFGSGAYGVEAAALQYFGHGAANGDAGRGRDAGRPDEGADQARAEPQPAGRRDRAAQVIAAMRDEGYITDAAAKDALAQPGPCREGARRRRASTTPPTTSWTCSTTRSAPSTRTSSSPRPSTRRWRRPASTRSTTSSTQGRASTASARARWCRSTPDGAIKALIGGRNYADSQFDRAVSAKRQPGSAFKPFVYLTALEKGLTPDTVREDAPINVKGWQPENYSREYFGPGDADQGAVAVAQHGRGAARPRGRAEGGGQRRRTGSASPPTCSPTPRSRSAPRKSRRSNSRPPTRPSPTAASPCSRTSSRGSRRAAGKLLYQAQGPSFGRVIDPPYVGMMNAMMQETLLTGTARKAELPGWQAAGKTGTSQDWRDAWFVGYTSRSSPASGSATTTARRPGRPRAATCRSRSGAAS